MTNRKALYVLFVACFALLLSSTLVQGRIYTFEDHMIPEGGLLDLRHGMYSVQDAKRHLLLDPFFQLSRHKTESTVRFNVQLKRSHTWRELQERQQQQQQQQHNVQIALLHSEELKYLGTPRTDGGKGRSLCARNESDPNSQHSLFIDPALKRGRFLLHDISLPPLPSPTVNDGVGDENDEIHSSVTFVADWSITRSGVYYMVLANCHSADSDITDAGWNNANVSGQITFLNPYGHLSSERYTLLPFFGILTVLYMLAGIVWLINNIIWLKNISQVQMMISAVLAITMVQIFISFGIYYDRNVFGGESIWLTLIIALITFFRGMAVRIFVLLISAGYGVTRDLYIFNTLLSIRNASDTQQEGPVVVVSSRLHGRHGEATKTRLHDMFLTCFAYLMVSPILVLRISEYSVSPPWDLIMTLLLVGTDAYFITWVVINMNALFKQLQIKRQWLKLRLINRLKWILSMFTMAYVLWIAYGLYLQYTSPNSDSLLPSRRYQRDERWESNWTEGGFWHILHFAASLLIMMLYRPSSEALINARNNASDARQYRGMYDRLDTEEEEDEDGNALDFHQHYMHIELVEEGEMPVTKKQPRNDGGISNSSDANSSRNAALTGFSFGDDDDDGNDDDE